MGYNVEYENKDIKIVNGYIIPKRQDPKRRMREYAGGEVELECFKVPIDWVTVTGIDGKWANRHRFVVNVLNEKNIAVYQVIFPELNAMKSSGPALVEIYRAKREEN